jgi:hypothetical protein
MVKIIIALLIFIFILYTAYIAFRQNKKPTLEFSLPNIPDKQLFTNSPIQIINFIFSTFKDKDLQTLFGATAVGNSNQSLGTLDALNINLSGSGKAGGASYSWSITGVNGLQSSILNNPPSCVLNGDIVYNTSLPYYAIDVPLAINFNNISLSSQVQYLISDPADPEEDLPESANVSFSASSTINCIFTYLYNVPIPYNIKIVSSIINNASVDLETSDFIVKAIVDDVAAGPISTAIQNVLPNVINNIIPTSLLNHLASGIYVNIGNIVNNIDFLTNALKLLQEVVTGIGSLTTNGVNSYITSLEQAIQTFSKDLQYIQYFLFFPLTLSPPYQVVNMGVYSFYYPVTAAKAVGVPAIEINSYPDLPTYTTYTQALQSYKSVTSISCNNINGLSRIKVNSGESTSQYINGTEDPKFAEDLNNNYIPNCRTYYCPKANIYEIYKLQPSLTTPQPETCQDCDTSIPINSWQNPSYTEECKLFYINDQGQCAYPGHKNNIPNGSVGIANFNCGSTSGSCYFNSSFNLGLCFDSYPMNDTLEYNFTDRQTYSKGKVMDGLACYHLQQSPGQLYEDGSYVGINTFKPQYANVGEGFAYYPNKKCGPSCILQGNVGLCQGTTTPCFDFSLIANNNTDTSTLATNLWTNASTGNYDASFYKCVS